MERHPLDQLHGLKRELVVRIRELYAQYLGLQAEYGPRIKSLAAEADRLATEFKPLVQQAVDAYASGAKALAKDLSNRRKDLQAQCEEANAQANVLRKELADLLGRLQAARQQLADTNDRIARYSRLRHMAIDGFAQAYGISADIVCEELSVLPPRLVRCIKRVTYVHRLEPDGAVGRTANKEENRDQTTIYLYISLASFDRAKLEEDYRHTVVHEAGHVLFDWVITAGQRWQWGEIYNQTLRTGGAFLGNEASKSLREDFGECLAEYIHRPDYLREYDLTRYTFINTILEEVAQ